MTEKINKCICIKNGFMDSGTQFCIKNHTYLWIPDDMHDFAVATENHLNKCTHYMNSKFFNTFFKFKTNTLKEFLKDGV